MQKITDSQMYPFAPVNVLGIIKHLAKINDDKSASAKTA